MKKRIITLGGMPGSGKSSTGRRLAQLLGYRRLSSGDFFREMAHRRGISVEEINQVAESDVSLDHETDAWIRAQAEHQDFVIDSRTAFHWIPDAFKVFLKLDPHVAAQRTFAHIQEEGRVGQMAVSVEDVYEKTVARIESEKRRYQTLYGLDYTDASQYDLVVDTGPNDLETVVRAIAEAYRQWLADA
ncbi:MAG TPA: cytidylate kinase family protein [Hyphomicrobiaceae bacterium]|nr:cytidylate kinase family protein [Hyphomicrobiaceae bacterium]